MPAQIGHDCRRGSIHAPETALLVLSGVAVIMPNYRGSLGYGKAFADVLVGNAGETDAACQI